MATLAPSRAKTVRDLLADAAGGTGDDCDLVLKTHRSFSFYRLTVIQNGLCQATLHEARDWEFKGRPSLPRSFPKLLQIRSRECITRRCDQRQSLIRARLVEVRRSYPCEQTGFCPF